MLDHFIRIVGGGGVRPQRPPSAPAADGRLGRRTYVDKRAIPRGADAMSRQTATVARRRHPARHGPHRRRVSGRADTAKPSPCATTTAGRRWSATSRSTAGSAEWARRSARGSKGMRSIPSPEPPCTHKGYAGYDQLQVIASCCRGPFSSYLILRSGNFCTVAHVPGMAAGIGAAEGWR